MERNATVPERYCNARIIFSLVSKEMITPYTIRINNSRLEFLNASNCSDEFNAVINSIAQYARNAISMAVRGRIHFFSIEKRRTMERMINERSMDEAATEIEIKQTCSTKNQYRYSFIFPAEVIVVEIAYREVFCIIHSSVSTIPHASLLEQFFHVQVL